MATTDTKTTDAANTKTAKETDYLSQIGANFNRKNAAEIFGGKGDRALDAVAALGYGRLTSAELERGISIPQENENHSAAKAKTTAELRAKINTALNNLG